MDRGDHRRPGGVAAGTGQQGGAPAELGERAHELAERISLVPPATAQLVKDSLNQTGDLMGKSASWKYHFMAHHWMHNTATAAAGPGGAQEKTP